MAEYKQGDLVRMTENSLGVAADGSTLVVIHTERAFDDLLRVKALNPTAGGIFKGREFWTNLSLVEKL